MNETLIQDERLRIQRQGLHPIEGGKRSVANLIKEMTVVTALQDVIEEAAGDDPPPEPSA